MLSASKASCMAVRVISSILLLVLIHTSVVMEYVANSSFPSRHQLMPAASAVGPGYHLRLSEGGLGLDVRP